MANRRKFLAGLGALASGSAAAVGTGAFTTASAERTMEVRVADDSAGYVGLYATDSMFSSKEDGQVKVDFSDVEGNGEGAGIGTFDGGKGVNPDATFNFEELFQIQNREYGGELRVVITTSGFNLDDIEITDSETGDSLMAIDYEDPANAPQVPGSAGKITTDISIETPDTTDMDAGGNLTIHAAAGDNYDNDSFSELFD